MFNRFATSLSNEHLLCNLGIFRIGENGGRHILLETLPLLIVVHGSCGSQRLAIFDALSFIFLIVFIWLNIYQYFFFLVISDIFRFIISRVLLFFENVEVVFESLPLLQSYYLTRTQKFLSHGNIARNPNRRENQSAQNALRSSREKALQLLSCIFVILSIIGMASAAEAAAVVMIRRAVVETAAVVVAAGKRTDDGGPGEGFVAGNGDGR
mmetsp:Transcript_21865/g.44806  ORF Transcript_21865/g.44806 Transcript_21865/m.44806 type:complete len:211 (+) Transcript_21865:415-1047(+)